MVLVVLALGLLAAFLLLGFAITLLLFRLTSNVSHFVYVYVLIFLYSYSDPHPDFAPNHVSDCNPNQYDLLENIFESKVGAALGLGAKKEKIKTIANVVNSKVLSLLKQLI